MTASIILPILSILLARWLLHGTNRKAIYIFSFLVLTFNSLGHFIPDAHGILYYLIAALTDLFIISILSKLTNITRLVLKMQRICVAFIIVNFIGWILYMLYLPPEAYTILCTILYLWVLTITIGGSRHVMGDSTMDHGNIRVFSNHPKRHYVLHTSKKAARD